MDTTLMYEDTSSLKAKGHLESRGILVVLSENFFGKTFIIERGENRIGRSDSADFCLKDDLISREHCRIIRGQDHRFFIEDLQSTNSSSVNGKKLKKLQQLCYGDRICLGRTVLRFFREESIQ